MICKICDGRRFTKKQSNQKYICNCCGNVQTKEKPLRRNQLNKEDKNGKEM